MKNKKPRKSEKDLSKNERYFGVIEKVGRDEFIVLEKRVMALEKAKK